MRQQRPIVLRSSRPCGLFGFPKLSKCEREEQPTAFGVDGIAIAFSFRASALPALARSRSGH